MTAFTIYWTPDGWENIGEGNLPTGAYGSGFSRKINKGDRVFITNIKDGKLRLISALTVEKIELADANIFGGTEKLIAQQSTSHPVKIRNLSKHLTKELRFISSNNSETNINMDSDGSVNGQTMRSVRQLTPESAALLESELIANANELWREDELRAAIIAYFEIQQKIRSGEKVIKKHYYRDLSLKFNRTAAAFEFRMQNISYVLSLAGRDWIRGLPPAKHVGTNVVAQLERLIAEVENKEFTAAAVNAQKLIDIRKSISIKPDGVKKPTTVTTTITSYSRDDRVKAWVLNRANGICEACDAPAPFLQNDGSPFLEVHHVRHLADGGSDTASNTIALCPNCHRQLHHSKDKHEYLDSLFLKIPHLKKE
jgi:predicted HNH restriction endonuclease